MECSQIIVQESTTPDWVPIVKVELINNETAQAIFIQEEIQHKLQENRSESSMRIQITTPIVLAGLDNHRQGSVNEQETEIAQVQRHKELEKSMLEPLKYRFKRRTQNRVLCPIQGIQRMITKKHALTWWTSFTILSLAISSTTCMTISTLKT